MMYYARPSLIDRIVSVVKALSGLLLCLVIFMAGMALQNVKETNAHEEFRVFLENLNAGLYDQRFDSTPAQFRLDSLESCLDGSYYISGKTYAYRFRGYTSENNLMGKLRWEFDSYPGFGGLEFWLQAIGFAGMATTACWSLIRCLFKLPPFSKWIRGED